MTPPPNPTPLAEQKEENLINTTEMTAPLETIPAAREWMSKNFPQADAIFTDALAIWLHEQIDEAVREARMKTLAEVEAVIQDWQTPKVVTLAEEPFQHFERTVPLLDRIRALAGR
jgi:hypothetical protein